MRQNVDSLKICHARELGRSLHFGTDQRNNISDFPNAGCNTGLHRWSATERLVNLGEVAGDRAMRAGRAVRAWYAVGSFQRRAVFGTLRRRAAKPPLM